MENIAYYAPAKVNFSLKIGVREQNNLHKIHSLARKIKISDKISFKLTEGDYKIKAVPGPILENRFTEEDFQSISDENGIIINSTINSAKSFFNALNIHNKGIDVTIEKNIPFNAGLGGGSSDGAGMLLKLNEVFDNALDRAELIGLALKLGSDMPFFLTSGDAIVSGFGENIEKIEPKAMQRYNIVLIIPDFGIKTKDAYAEYDDFMLTNKINYYNMQYLDFKDLNYVNDFEPVIFKKYPVLKEMKESLILNGAEISLLSGSGSTVFGAFKTGEEAVSYLYKLKSFRFYKSVRLSCLTETL